jgi:hypothetical protein
MRRSSRSVHRLGLEGTNLFCRSEFGFGQVLMLSDQLVEVYLDGRTREIRGPWFLATSFMVTPFDSHLRSPQRRNNSTIIAITMTSPIPPPMYINQFYPMGRISHALGKLVARVFDRRVTGYEPLDLGGNP